MGFLGPGPIEDQVRHSLRFVRLVEPSPGRAVDLGSGGGLPGLVLARLLAVEHLGPPGWQPAPDRLSGLDRAALGMGDRVRSAVSGRRRAGGSLPFGGRPIW